MPDPVGVKDLKAPALKQVEEPLMVFPLEDNTQCLHCPSIEIDAILWKGFHVPVCQNCREGSDDYRLTTKTAAKEEFLLTDEELGDEKSLPRIIKPNPHKSTWSEMHLFLRKQIEEFAYIKWHGANGLEEERRRRADAADSRRSLDFKRKLAALKKQTRVEKSSRSTISKHVHQFELIDGTMKCTECNLKVIGEEL